jgi:hypothetical protein
MQTVRLTETAAAAYEYWHKQKTGDLKDLIAQCAGLWFEAYVDEPAYALGTDIKIRAQVIKQSDAAISFSGVSLVQPEVNPSTGSPIVQNQLKTIDLTLTADKLSQPYWLESPHGNGSYSISDDIKVGNPENPDAPAIIYSFNIGGRQINYTRKLVYKYANPARGEIYQPLVIAPAVTANIGEKTYVYNSTQPQTVQVKLKSYTNASGSISLKPVAGWKISPEKIDFNGKIKGDEWTVIFTVSPTDNRSGTNVLEAVVNANGKTSSLGVLNIKYEHIPAITLFPPAQAKLVNIDLKTAGKKIGYIAGAGDLIPESLREVGYDVHTLSENEIINTDLSYYDAIITGVRAFNVNERLVYEQPKLLDYVKNGGTLLVQYNNNNGLLVRDIGPYPFRVVNERVTDETVPITITDAQSQVLNYPNKITQDDFKGWIQERGLYFVSGIDAKYQTPLQMNDPGESSKNGSLIVADYGKGRFVYTSLAFFRELPAGVPGAYRLFINLLSKPKN